MQNNIVLYDHPLRLVYKEGPILTFTADIGLSGFATIITYDTETNNGSLLVLPVIYNHGYRYYPYIMDESDNKLIFCEKYDNTQLHDVLDKASSIINELVTFTSITESDVKETRLCRGNVLIYKTHVVDDPYMYQCSSYSNSSDILLLAIMKRPVFKKSNIPNTFSLKNAAKYSFADVFKRI